MEEIHEYNNYLKVTYLQTGKLGEAVTYLNNQWEYLMNYLKDGEAALSNNLALSSHYFYPHILEIRA
jgi:transposase